MGFYSYKIEHDFGLAPNPFGGYCTLAVCKPAIRRNKNLEIGDWIFGTGSVKLKCLHHLIYAMKTEEIITFQKYWEDPRFQYKKPVINGSLVQLYGDNFYHQNEKGKWIQENSAHSISNNKPNNEHLRIDTGGENVIISRTFYYFGSSSFLIPEKYWKICSEGRSLKSNAIPEKIAESFVKWLEKKFAPGIYGDPINWQT
jgi:hypothetical protein